jgi:2-polyprenyl-3-methyl-5-hydroxy-6-metoxy-1,4-benzoquinol methylase
MKPSETASSYDQIAEHWNSDEFDRFNGIAQHERALQFTMRRESAIDIGCGSSGRIIDWMLAQHFQPEGLDLSSEMIRLARERHPTVLFHQADICTWEFPKKYDFISAWDSVWHAPLEEQESILVKLCSGLTPKGVLIYTTGGLDKPGSITNPCMGQPLHHAALGIPQTLQVVAACGCICRHLEYDQYPENHLYLVIQKI